MMRAWGYPWTMTWGGGVGFEFLAVLFWLVLLIDLILLGMWLWKQIQKK